MGPLLSLLDISKRFPGVIALDGVSLEIGPGEIHALMGENGAGKSTLIKILTGVHKPDSGQILLEGRAVSPSSPQHAIDLGISTVYQEVNLVPNLSIAENLALGREPRGRLGIQWKLVKDRARAALDQLGLKVDVDVRLGSCSVAVQQMTAIARALEVQAKVIVLDEPTSSLDRDEVVQLFGILRHLRDQGISIIFVTHFLDQVYEIADCITVLRNGRLVATSAVDQLPKIDLVTQMIGKEIGTQSGDKTEYQGERTPILSARSLGYPNGIEGLTLDIGKGEIVGFAGLLGSGRTEAIRLFFGMERPTQGELRVRGKAQRSTGDAIKNGLGLCPEDRREEGILPELSIRENMVLVIQSKRGWWRKLSQEIQAELVDRFMAKLSIAATDGEQPIQLLSGGNQQKVLLARWLAANPILLLLDEPTRGIDVGAKFEISELIEELRVTGMAFVLVSSELEEIVRDSTKAVVLRDRNMVTAIENPSLEEILSIIAGESV